MYKQPHSAEPVLWHQDNGYTFVEPQAYLTCWIAITDATLENGCVDGHARRAPRRHPRPPRHADRLRVRGRLRARRRAYRSRAGTIVVFTSLTPHSTAAQPTDEVRKAYIVQYAPDGAVAYEGLGDEPRPDPRRLDDPARQFLVG